MLKLGSFRRKKKMILLISFSKGINKTHPFSDTEKQILRKMFSIYFKILY